METCEGCAEPVEPDTGCMHGYILCPDCAPGRCVECRVELADARAAEAAREAVR